MISIKPNLKVAILTIAAFGTLLKLCDLAYDSSQISNKNNNIIATTTITSATPSQVTKSHTTATTAIMVSTSTTATTITSDYDMSDVITEEFVDEEVEEEESNINEDYEDEYEVNDYEEVDYDDCNDSENYENDDYETENDYEDEYSDCGYYTAKWYSGSEGSWGYSGRELISGYSVASPDFPQGTLIYISGGGIDGVYRVDDTGCPSGVIDFFYYYGDVPTNFEYDGTYDIQVSVVE